MSWKTANRSFYYATAEEPEDIDLDPAKTALLVIDIQNTYLEPKDTPEETARWLSLLLIPYDAESLVFHGDVP